MIFLLFALQGVAIPRTARPDPPVCIAATDMIAEISHLGQNIVIEAAGKQPAFSPEGRELIAAREKLALAMKDPSPDLDAIERAMREVARLEDLITDRFQAAKLACDVAYLRRLEGSGLRQALDLRRPRTAAEMEERRRRMRNAPPPAAPPPSPQPR